MFGYIRYDFPNLFIKDYMLYRAAYCGLCKGIARSCGQTARMGLSYDLAFLSVLLHNMRGEDLKIEDQHCFEHVVSKRPIALVDGLTEKLGALNTILVYFKLTDDISDGDRGRGKRLWFKKGYKRAKQAYPQMEEIVRRNMAEQDRVERAKSSSLDMAAEASANMMRELSNELLGEKGSEYSRQLFYCLGKWIYLIDALDDYEKDKKKNAYNPFVLSYGENTRAELIEAHQQEICFVFDTLFYSMRESLSHIPFTFNRDLTDNIILRGIQSETARVMRGERRKKETQVKV